MKVEYLNYKEDRDQSVVGMKPSTSKASSSVQSPLPEEPLAEYVNDNLPDPDDEPELSDITPFHAGEEMQRQNSEVAHAKYEKTRPQMIADQRVVTAQLYHRYTEDEERKRIEQQKNKEAMNASATPISRNSHGETRKRRNEVVTQSAEDEWKRAQQQQQHWINQNPMQHNFHMQQHYQQQQHQQYMMQQQQHHMASQQHHGMPMHHNNQMPSTSSADSVGSVPTPASMHQPSPVEMRNGSGMSTSRSAMDISSPSNLFDQQGDENTLTVPEGEWFDKLAGIVAAQYNADTVLGPDTYDELLKFPEPIVQNQSPNGSAQNCLPATASIPNPQQQHQHQMQQNKMRLLQQQQEMQKMEQQRQQQIMQAQQHQRHQMLLQQQQMQQHQQQMNGGFQNQQQQAAFMHAQRMQQMRLHQQQQQQQQQHQQQQQQHIQMGYGVPNGYPHQAPMHHPQAYGHHMPQHTPFANIN
uniref:PAT1 domain containing protein n=2 Tax=Caenorhabditis tropicalis TaxID=1561998 RepID=A0A1I7UHX4_9PELO